MSGPGFFRRLFRIFRFRSDVERELDEELSFHLERTLDELMEGGMSRDAAEREARRRFGSVGRYRRELARIDRGRTRVEETRERLEAVAATIGDALRGLRRSPGFVAAVVLTLALGIGANVTMFRVVDRLLLRPPDHVVEPDAVKRLYVRRRGFNGRIWTSDFWTFPDYRDLEEVGAFRAVGAYGRTRDLTLGRGDEAVKIRGAPATAGFFAVLGVRPALGRFYTEEEARFGGRPTAVLSHDFWLRRFGGDPDVLGRTLEIGEAGYTVVGVAPRSFTGAELEPVDVWLPLEVYGGIAMGEGWRESRSWWWIQVVARLSPGSGVEAAGEEATAVHRAARSEIDDYDPEARVLTASLIPGEQPDAGAEVAVSGWLAGVSAIVLLIACANVANLLLARGTRRRREVAVRVALGISRKRLLGELLVESFVLALLGGGAALLLARWGGGAVQSVLLPNVSLTGGILDPRILLFTGGAVILAALAAGILPGHQAGRTDVVPALKAGSRGASAPRSRTRVGLLVLQAALSVVLLAGAGLFVRSLHEVRTVDLGLDPEGVVLVRLEVADAGPEGALVLEEERTAPDKWPPDEAAEIYDRALERAALLPGVEEATMVNPTPFWGSISTDLRVPSMDSLPSLPSGGPYIYAVGPRYFEAMEIALLRGRPLRAGDHAPGSPRVAVINETMARTIWPGEDPLGRCLIVASDEAPCSEVVGVVEDSRRQEVVDEEAQMLYYVPIRQQQLRGGPSSLLLRTDGGSEAPLGSIRRALETVSPRIRFVDVRPFRELLDRQLRSWRLGATMFTVFGLLALVVAAVGLYSVLSFDVAQRTYELGIRSALGATKERLVGLVVREAIVLVGAGIALGLAVALVAGRWLEPLLYRVAPEDPLVLGGVVASLGLIALLASSVPALRAGRVDPNRALRAE